MAAGLIWAAAKYGLKVPDDLSVAGFDDIPLARQLWPPLTTVRQPSRDMGKIAATQLLESLRGRGSGRAGAGAVFAASCGSPPARRRLSR